MNGVDSMGMCALRRIGPFLVVVALTAACASRVRVASVSEAPQVRYRRVMDEAGIAVRQGRTLPALEKYMEVARDSGIPALSREAYLQAGLLRLGGDVAVVDIAEAARLLRECRSRFERADEPLVLTATLAAIDRLESVEQGAAAATATAARESARLDEDARALRRTVVSLRQQLDKRDEALRKAADAAVGTTRPR